MSVTKLVENRRSVRKYTNEQVKESLMHELLQQAALLCPQPEQLAATRLLLVQEDQPKKQFVSAMVKALTVSKLGKWVPNMLQDAVLKRSMEIPGHLVVITKSDSDSRTQDEYTAEACYLLQALQLLAWEQGIGMLWNSEEFLYKPIFLDSLPMNEGERLLGVLHFGYVDKTPRPRQRTDVTKRWREYPNVT